MTRIVISTLTTASAVVAFLGVAAFGVGAGAIVLASL